MTTRHWLEVYFDEAGYTGENLADPAQPNYLFAAIVVPPGSSPAFWPAANEAWSIASGILGAPPDAIELKASDLFPGWGLFEGVALAERIKVLAKIFDSVVDHRISVMWDGAPKRLWEKRLQEIGLSRREHPTQSSWTLAFCCGLYDLLSSISSGCPIHIVGDENDWIKAGCRLEMRDPGRWSRLVGNGIEFDESKKHLGLQIADIFVNTLHRANRATTLDASVEPPALSGTDRLAVSFHKKLQDAGLWFNVTSNLARLRGERTA